MADGSSPGDVTTPVVASGNLLTDDEVERNTLSDTDVIQDINGVTPDADGIITITTTTVDASGATVDLGTLVVYTQDFGGNSAGDTHTHY